MVVYAKHFRENVPQDENGNFDESAFREYFDTKGYEYISELARMHNMTRQGISYLVKTKKIPTKRVLNKVYVHKKIKRYLCKHQPQQEKSNTSSIEE